MHSGLIRHSFDCTGKEERRRQKIHLISLKNLRARRMPWAKTHPHTLDSLKDESREGKNGWRFFCITE
ncbi:hypothetical protein LFML04_0778 [Leptospirillum ferriphilum ML-04]|uniref:Uncharacterized protein n=1 Tax=Leptospirillum ferriphilum (strain ML-04) TaxID=1048260 RepID=J9ZB88_LEPFM|nr:hypothetical protein LFML04_0778 [Leptospirillum ferriphilum ML-04]